MTITFKDERGHECTLALIGSTKGGYVRDATHDDILRALGLSTEGGPTDEACTVCGGSGWTYAAPAPGEAAGATVDCPCNVRRNPDAGELVRLFNRLDTTYDGITEPSRVGACLALFTAGSASRQPEVDRLTARIADLKLALGDDAGWFDRCKRAESELTATKARVAELEALPAASRLEKVERDRWETMWRDAEQRAEAAKEKLAEVERERGHAHDSAEELLAKLERARADVLELGRLVLSAQSDTLAARKVLREFVDHLGWADVTHPGLLAEWQNLRDALASAPAADRNEAKASDCSSWWLALPYEVEAIPFCFPPNRKGDSSCAEPPRAEKPACKHQWEPHFSAEMCKLCGRCRSPLAVEPPAESKPDPCHRCGSPANVNDGDDGMGPPVCVRCFDAESKPEPHPSAIDRAIRALYDVRHELTAARRAGAISRTQAVELTAIELAIDTLEATERRMLKGEPETQPSGDLAFPWRADSGVIYDALGRAVFCWGSLSPWLAELIVKRCNAPEPSASVARGEVEAIVSEAEESWKRGHPSGSVGVQMFNKLKALLAKGEVKS